MDLTTTLGIAPLDEAAGSGTTPANGAANGNGHAADPARARTMGGTGLGLSISMEDARLHGGWLTAWGRPGMGAQFRLTLPRRAGAILEQSPLPLVPRDLVGPSVARLDGLELAQPLVAHEPATGSR